GCDPSRFHCDVVGIDYRARRDPAGSTAAQAFLIFALDSHDVVVAPVIGRPIGSLPAARGNMVAQSRIVERVIEYLTTTVSTPLAAVIVKISTVSDRVLAAQNR